MKNPKRYSAAAALVAVGLVAGLTASAVAGGVTSGGPKGPVSIRDTLIGNTVEHEVRLRPGLWEMTMTLGDACEGATVWDYGTTWTPYDTNGAGDTTQDYFDHGGGTRGFQLDDSYRADLAVTPCHIEVVLNRIERP